MTQPQPRKYTAKALSTDVFGRVLVNARDQHLVVDGPVQNGCPGEALTPPEAFLGGVASCGVELVQVIARETNVPIRGVKVDIEGVVDRANQSRPDVTLFNAVRLDVHIKGVTEPQARTLVEGFKRR